MQPAATRLETAGGSWVLRRYPGRRHDPLQAWCGADLLLIDAASARNSRNCLVVNDEHGALCVALQPQLAWTDSALAAMAAEQNLQANALPPVPLCWSTDTPQLSPDLVLMRVPKLNAYFEYQLAQLHAIMPIGVELICSGMDKHLSPHTADTITAVFGNCERHRGARKARTFSARREPGLPPTPPAAVSYHCPFLDTSLAAMSNVFSAGSLDIGSRFLLETLPQIEPVDRVADLACGNGVLGLCARHSGIGKDIHFFDESAMAVASARRNWEALFPAERAHFQHGDGLLGCDTAFDLILCNPPFHLGHSVDDYAGRRLLQQCAKHLSATGSLVIVANRHLPYGKALRRDFRAVSVIAENARFRIWRAASVA